MNLILQKSLIPLSVDFTNTFKNIGTAFIKDLIHIAKIDVKSSGIEAAGVTITVGDTGGNDQNNYELVYSDFILDKSFGYFIEDSYGNILFSGVVNKI